MEWRGCEVVDQDGDKVGKLDEIYIDRETQKPEWAVVNTGLFGRKSSFVPLKDALREGDMIRVPYQKEHIKEAPSVDPDGEISPEEEQSVYAHYGLEYSQTQSGSGLPEGETAAGTATGRGGESGAGTAAAAAGVTAAGGTGSPGDGAGDGRTTDDEGTPAASELGRGDMPAGTERTDPQSATSGSNVQPGGDVQPGGAGGDVQTGGAGGDVQAGGTGREVQTTGTAGDVQTTGGTPGTQSPRGGGLRLQRMIQEDIRLDSEGEEVVERKMVQQERLSSEGGDENGERS